MVWPEPACYAVTVVTASRGLFVEVVAVDLWNLHGPGRDPHFVVNHQASQALPIDQHDALDGARKFESLRGEAGRGDEDTLASLLSRKAP